LPWLSGLLTESATQQAYTTEPQHATATKTPDPSRAWIGCCEHLQNNTSTTHNCSSPAAALLLCSFWECCPQTVCTRPAHTQQAHDNITCCNAPQESKQCSKST
jgi:hypothetical protein